MKKFSNIRISSNKGIARILLNEKETYNALSLKTIRELIKVFKIYNNDKENKVIIIEGAGKGFSAGHNLKELKKFKNKNKFNQIFNSCSELMMLIVNNNKPVIAKVHGAAFAAGCQLVASCDLALSSKDAIFATPGVNIGLFCSTPMVALSRKVSRKRSMKMLLTGDFIDAKYAKEIGLINDYYNSKYLEEETLKLANKIASKSSLILKIGKKAFYHQLELPLKKAYKYTSKIMSENMMTLDANEGISSFLEKRSPNWKNK
tara:strand:- start:6676 stop:7458 length:783 start_codon:yes stop_codon:yes gene_type:complete